MCPARRKRGSKNARKQSERSGKRMAIKAVVFDFGGVLIGWNPEYVYSRLIPDATERRWFMDNVVAMDWVLQQDAGQTIADGNAELIARFPEHEALIRAFYERWQEMLGACSKMASHWSTSS